MAIYGYARVSTKDQDLTLQQEALMAAGCEIVRSEKMSGTTTENRDELKTLLSFLRNGDTLMITKVDRLARSVRDLQNIVYELNEKGVALKATDQPIDTTTAAGKCFLDMLSVFASFETELRKERQAAGIQQAKKRGVYKGRQATIETDRVNQLKAEGLGATVISRELGVSVSSVYRLLK